ncbi:MAG: hypothetical protein PHI68_01620 [Candidatus Cloacimonetes bacterium]|nr:hypothetical protein [Candidatus Cloacimonadota bacterium]
MGSTILFLEKDALHKPNLLANPSFALLPDSMNVMPSGWTIIGQRDDYLGKVLCDSLTRVESGNSIRITGTRKPLMIISDPFKVDRFGGFFAKISALSSDDLGPRVRFRFITYNASGKIRNSFSSSLKSAQHWKKASISAGFLKTDVRFARLIILVPPTQEATLWINDAGCYEVHRFPLD